MIVVTGGAGFIGSNVVAALAERGEVPVVCDVLGADEKWQNLVKHELTDIISPDELWPFLDANRPDTVIHMGANSSTTERDGDLILDQNFRYTLRLWKWCAGHNTRLIYASSAATYGGGLTGFADDDSIAGLGCLRPLNLYGWSKHLFDRRVARDVADGAPLPPQWVGLKFFNVFGPNEFHKGPMRSVVLQAFEQLQSGATIKLFKSHRADYSDGGQLRDFIYVRDCTDVILWLLDSPKVSGLYNLGTGTARTFADLAAAACRSLNRAVDITYVDMPGDLRGRYQYETQAVMTRLRQAGYNESFTSLEDGVADYIQNYLIKDDRYR
ncbi:MAG: ADP-glyceromanno-heptose 6-epimerase [Proteobacteria bacterium]|nr:ADP-glyceromanno-heptose 6-epimerase [Pseudomonadota bacterium]